MASIIKVDQIQTAAGGTPTAADLGINTTGSVLQVVQAVKDDTFSSTSTSWTDITSLSVSITPISTSSKIMLFVCLHGGGTGQTPRFKVLRNSTDVGVGIAAGSRVRAGFGTGYARDSNQIQSMNWSYLDSPNTISSIVYKVQGHNDNGATWHINRSQDYQDTSTGVTTVSTITAIEIAG